MNISVSRGNNKSKMSRFGIGPILAPLSILYCLAVLAVTRHYAPLFDLTVMPDTLRLALGTLLALGGLIFFVVAVISLSRAYNADRLNTRGVFACCRNPIYAAWIVFIVPGLVLLADSWLGMTAPLVMYILLKIFIKKEEQYLEEKFGRQYRVYRENVPEVLPIGWIKKYVF